MIPTLVLPRESKEAKQKRMMSELRKMEAVCIGCAVGKFLTFA
jgi:hypothetical protein